MQDTIDRAVPVTFDDPVNARILAVSEDRLQGFQPEPFQEISRLSGVALPTVLERIRGGLDFATAARQFSQDRFTTYLGGDIGYFQPGSMYVEFEKAAFDLEPGEVSDVVRTPVGFHIIQVTESHNDNLLLMVDGHRRASAIGHWKAAARENANVESYLKAQ